MSDEIIYKAQTSELRKRVPAPLMIAGGGILLLLAVTFFGVSIGSLIGAAMVSGFGLLLMIPAWKSTEDDRSRASFLAVPGAFLAMLGALQFLAALFQHGEIWSYGWLLLPAAAVGGLMYAKRFNKMARVHVWGQSVLRILVTLTLAFGLFLELLVYRTFGPLWPFMVIGLGVYLFIRHQRSKA